MALINFDNPYNISSLDLRKYKKLDEEEHTRITRRRMYKGARPWELVDVTATLDNNEPWVGMEWENGFCSLSAFRAVVDYTWINYHHVTVDAEGPGPFYGEFTFAPIEASKFFAGESPFDGVLNFMLRNDLRMPKTPEDVQFATPEEMKSMGFDDDGYDPEEGWYAGHRYLDGNWSSGVDLQQGWGIHANISTPLTRGASDDEHMCASNIINHYLATLSEDEQVTLFGRVPYGAAFAMKSKANKWYEFKLFQTTDDPDTIAQYKTVIAGLIKLIDIAVLEATANFGGTARFTLPKPRPGAVAALLTGKKDYIERYKTARFEAFPLHGFDVFE